MLNLPVYLYTPAIRVFIDLENSTILGIDDMFHGYANIAKGIKNTIRFNFLNGEQRTVNISGKNFRFNLYEPATNKRVLSKGLTILDDTVSKTIATAQTAIGKTITLNNVTNISVGQSVYGVGIPKNTTVFSITGNTVTLNSSTTAIAPVGSAIKFVTYNLRGSAELTLMGNDTININAGKYNYSIYLEDLYANELMPVFVDGASSMTGVAELVDTINPIMIESSDLIFNQVPDNKFTTGKVAANRDGKGSPELHTAAIYFNNFTGNFKIYGTLNNSVDGDTANWALLSSTDHTNKNVIEYANLYGAFNFFKFEYTKTSGSIDKVLYRS